MHRQVAVLFAALFLTTPVMAARAPPPKIAIDSFAQLQTPLPFPYDEAAHANAQVARARARAKASGKLLLIDLGGNWCGDCLILSATMDRPDLKPFLAKHYTTVLVDVGRFDKNLQIPAHWGITERLEGVPALLIVDPKTDRLLDAGHVSALSDARYMTPQALADWLAQWTR
jgi:hypothetical protein